MEKFEVKKDIITGSYYVKCNSTCSECELYKYAVSIGKMNVSRALKRLGIQIKNKNSACYTLYDYIYRKELKKKVEAWKNLK